MLLRLATLSFIFSLSSLARVATPLWDLFPEEHLTSKQAAAVKQARAELCIAAVTVTAVHPERLVEGGGALSLILPRRVPLVMDHYQVDVRENGLLLRWQSGSDPSVSAENSVVLDLVESPSPATMGFIEMGDKVYRVRPLTGGLATIALFDPGRFPETNCYPGF